MHFQYQCVSCHKVALKLKKNWFHKTVQSQVGTAQIEFPAKISSNSLTVNVPLTFQLLINTPTVKRSTDEEFLSTSKEPGPSMDGCPGDWVRFVTDFLS